MDDDLLTSEEAARRLGIKLPTLYAYVSRGLLDSHAVPGGRRRVFARGDVERLANRSRQGKEVETRLATVTTAITQLDADGPHYRGRPVRGLVDSWTFEEVTALLWDVDPGPFEPVAIGKAPARMGDVDRLVWAVVGCAAKDHFRGDLRPEAVTAAARRVIATGVASLPERAVRPAPDLRLTRTAGGSRKMADSLAGLLTDRLATTPVGTATVEAVNAILVTLADHELATAALAARVAASTRSDVYGVLLAGLGTMRGPLHGAASNGVRRLLEDAHRSGAPAAMGSALSGSERLAGFGHVVYADVDPRAAWLLDRARSLATATERRTIDEVLAVAAERELPPPNVDLGLGALTWTAHLVADAGETIFTVARHAGLVAHALEELDERPLRFRARAVYSTRP